MEKDERGLELVNLSIERYFSDDNQERNRDLNQLQIVGISSKETIFKENKKTV